MTHISLFGIDCEHIYVCNICRKPFIYEGNPEDIIINEDSSYSDRHYTYYTHKHAPLCSKCRQKYYRWRSIVKIISIILGYIPLATGIFHLFYNINHLPLGETIFASIFGALLLGYIIYKIIYHILGFVLRIFNIHIWLRTKYLGKDLSNYWGNI